MNRNRILIIVAVVLVVLVVSFQWQFNVNPGGKLPRLKNIISLQNVGLCASNCIYPSPELSATVFVNGSVPLSNLHLFINGTDEGRFVPFNATFNTMTNYALPWKTVLFHSNNAMPLIAGKTYTITVVATFQDNSTCTVSATVVASSGSGITTTNT